MEMFNLAQRNINRAFDIVARFDGGLMASVRLDEDAMDTMADRVSGYLMQISAHITSDEQTEIMNHYYSTISEFERLGDHAMNIAEDAEEMNQEGVTFSETALKELGVVRDLLRAVLNYTGKTFEKCDANAAAHIEPLEEVVDDMVNALRQNHLERLRLASPISAPTWGCSPSQGSSPRSSTRFTTTSPSCIPARTNPSTGNMRPPTTTISRC